MANDNVLRKEFNPKDVERARNLIKGKGGDNTQILVGYNKNEIIREEGEIWEEDGRTWVIKNGIKQNIPKLKSLGVTPLFCPECNKIMKKVDKKFYQQHKRCLNCQTVFETNLKSKGEWNLYKNKIINDDIDNLIKEYSIWVDEELKKTNSSSYITEGGEQENWVGNIKHKLLKDKEETIKYLNSLKK
jgi:phage FluMu protein Com